MEPDHPTARPVDDFVLAQGIADWPGAGRVPAHPPNLLARVCVPLRCHRLLLGYLWLIDPAETVTEEEIGVATEVAEQVGLLLYRRLLLHERDQARIGSLLRDLVSPDTEARVRAAAEIRDDELLAGTDHVVVLAVDVFGADGAAREQAAVALSAAIEAATRLVPPRAVLAFAHGCRALALLATTTPPSATVIDEFVGVTRREFTRRKGKDDRIVVGIGTVRHGLTQVAESHRQATTATRAARLLPRLGPVARWEQLGPYALLLQLPLRDIVAEDWIPSLKAIREADAQGVLVPTLETFLDNAGDVQRTARQLRIHRTTLYHRLQRIEEVVQVDLRDGTDRLALHLGLKLARLTEA